MRGYFTPEQVRAAEAPLLAALPDGALMRRAAYGLAGVVAAELLERTGGVAGRRVTLLVGSGDNGGDALHAGAFLRRRGVRVDAVLLAPDRAHRAGLEALRNAGGRVVVRPDTPDLVVDGIVGISARGPLRPAAAELVADLRAPIVAADTPSGVDVSTGATGGPHVTAAVTVAFGAYKPVHALAPRECGRVESIDIGLALSAPDSTCYDDADVRDRWPVPGPLDDKYSQGVVGIAAGSHAYPGAAVLATGAAVRATSGMVRYAGTARPDVLAAWPEVVAADRPADAGRVQAWAVGPGFGTDDESASLLAALLATNLPLVIDADALTLLARSPIRREAPTLLTPHAGEFARLADAIAPEAQRLLDGGDRVGAARALALELGATVLLKGFVTVVADPQGHAVLDTAGSAWAATPGSGDVLTGMCGALLASGLSPLEAGGLATRVHSQAADRAAGGAPTSASSISAAVTTVLREVLGRR
ncbi:NAD(P)H-hydrate dehydratase [Tsukamurella sp. 8F]|uniref:NAD(P)H-hydrate dehydratase n=1 Tax=unclassified Tsukamurella TaxID=2633480 RepID=UPI0023B928DC|nr:MULTISPECIES: NAD(P)H-hydrate dehydratase [unclassified Tsukamurella]MDF0531765.1 NAD(P)H-hydrate dehydratase [Tsukamurella sp. 8J]MDF0588033.1 NAD(P)H-hydrate dehydratase [Tsukamurella sp. 8F]